MEVANELFQKSISFLSKQNFKQLELIFTLIMDVQPLAAPNLLRELSLSKKTMSQQFLEELLDKQMQISEANKSYNYDFWSLLSHILDLDIEIGIKHMDRLLDLIIQQRASSMEETIIIWTKIINCHANARELLQFLEKLQKYCKKVGTTSMFFIRDKEFANEISRNIPGLSIRQMVVWFDNLFDSLQRDSTEVVEYQLLKTCLQGLPHLSYIILPELKNEMLKIFNIQLDTNIKQWELRYLIMEVYDDIIPQNVLESLSLEDLAAQLSQSSDRLEVFYYFFKLREYKEFDLTPVIGKFMSYLGSLTKDDKSLIIISLFSNWSSLINVTFSRENIEQLIDILLASEGAKHLDALFFDDDFFEEENIINVLVDKMAELYETDIALQYLTKIPIQSFNKNVRVRLINNICSKDTVTDLGVKVLLHLLSSPTFKSNVENDPTLLYSLLSHASLSTLLSINSVFEKIWVNHVSQYKEDVSQTFFDSVLKLVTKGLEEENFNKTYFDMAFMIIKFTKKDVDINTLSETYFQRTLHKVNELVDNSNGNDLLSSLLKSLYLIFRESLRKENFKQSVLEIISRLMGNYKGAVSDIDTTLLSNIFLLYSVFYEGKLEYIIAHYMVLREVGTDKQVILPGLEDAIVRSLEENMSDFNGSLISTINALNDGKTPFTQSLLEIYNTQIKMISKTNVIAIHLFVKSISSLYTNLKYFVENTEIILGIFDTLRDLLISKPWMFSQYCIEQLFPLCILLNSLVMKNSDVIEKVFTSCTKLAYLKCSFNTSCKIDEPSSPRQFIPLSISRIFITFKRE